MATLSKRDSFFCKSSPRVRSRGSSKFVFSTILVQAYSFTDKQIAQALVDASQRNVKVQILLDKSNRNSDVSAKNILVKHKLPLRFDSLSGIAHNKVMIIDESTVLSGSYNFSRAAYARNAENLIAIHDPELAQQYIQNWNKRWDEAKKSS